MNSTFASPGFVRAPRSDWDRAPWNRWTFQNIRQVMPTASIRRAAQPAALPSATGDLTDFRFATPDGGVMRFGEMLENTYTDAIFIYKDGRCLQESYHNGMGVGSLHLLQSVSKSIVSTTAGCLVAAGLMDVAAPVTEYLPELAATAYRGATLQHLLDMTSGVRFSEDYLLADSDMGMLDISAGWKDGAGPACVWDQILGLKTALRDHGAAFEYRSIETDVLALAMERVTGQSLAALISQHIWQPMGAEEDADITVDRAGYGLASGGISASLRDMARFGLMLLGGQVVPRDWIQDIRHGAHGLFDPNSYRNWPKGRYRNQFWIEDSDLGRHYCFGVFGQMVMVAPDTGFMAVKLSSWPDFVNPRLYHLTMAALRAVERDPVAG